MIQALLAFLPFIREVIFGTKPDPKKKQSSGKFLRLVIYALILASLATNYFLVKKSYSLSVTVIKQKEQLKNYSVVKERLGAMEATNAALVEIVYGKLHRIEAEVEKNTKPGN